MSPTTTQIKKHIEDLLWYTLQQAKDDKKEIPRIRKQEDFCNSYEVKFWLLKDIKEYIEEIEFHESINERTGYS